MGARRGEQKILGRLIPKLPDAKSPVPVNTVLPYITGIGQVGSTLTANVGEWTTTGPTTYLIQWMQDGVAIPGITGANYTPIVPNVPHKLTIDVQARNQFGPSLHVESYVPQFAIYSTPVIGGPPTILFESETQERTHIRVSPNGLYYSYTMFFRLNGEVPPVAIEDGNDYNDTEIVINRISDGVDVGRIAHNPLYANSNNPWLPDSSAIVFLSTDPALTSNGKVCIAKYTLATNASTTVWNPNYPVSDPHVRFDGKIAHVKGGGPVGQIYVLSGGVDIEITNPPLSGFPGAGDTDPEWNGPGTKIACSRRVAVGVYRIVVVTLDVATLVVSNELEIVPQGSAGAIDGTPKWTSDGRIVFWHIDPLDRASNGLYLINSDGTGIQRLPHPTHTTASQPVIQLGVPATLPTTRMYFSGRYIPIFF